MFISYLIAMKKLLTICILSLIALANASYLTRKAFEIKAGSTTQGFCDLNGTLSCSNVLTAPEAWIGSIPFPAVALAVYPILFCIALWGIVRKKHSQASNILAYLSGAGILFNSYFILTEAIVIKAFCPLCLLCTGIIITIFILSLKGRQED